MKIVNVKTSTTYNVIIGENLLGNTGALCTEVKSPCKAAIISDDKVYPLYGNTVKNSLEKAGYTVCNYVFPNGEKSKNLGTYAEILGFLAENKLTRTDIIVALGGGVCGDMAGFCAATYLRGIDFIQIPTTVLSAVDSSVGGKTAVDLPSGKNLVGAFHQPALVICDTDTFSTLDTRQKSCGLAEIIKYGVICDRELFEILESEENTDFTKLVARCVEIKRDIVERDEFDKGDRKLLNLGHTLGHAVETHSNFSLTHGEAVAIGMMMISKISEKCRYAKEKVSEKLGRVLEKHGLPVDYAITQKELYDLASGDKKAEGKSITPVIPETIGRCVLQKMPMEQFDKLIQSLYNN